MTFRLDYVVYSSGFAVESKGPSGEKIVEPLENCLQVVKTIVKGTLDLFDQDQTPRLFLGGKGNFRNEIATIQPYKGNRDPNYKPHWYKEIREYLQEKWGAELVNDQEADDMVCQLQWSAKDKSTCIVGNDKDLLGCPGHHYNWKKKEYCYQTLQDANLHFLHQLGTGDRVDNIRGLDGVGDKTALKIVAKHKGDYKAILRDLQDRYEKQHPGKGLDAMIETGTLLWMTRTPGKDWTSYFPDWS